MSSAYTPLRPLTEEFSHVKRVAVIGAGVAGLQMGQACKAHGLAVVIFDKAPKVGGVWHENYCGYGLQVPKQLYEFPDFPNTFVRWGEYPTGAETATYIEAYAEHFELGDALRLSTEIVEMRKRPDGQKGWTLVTRSTHGGPQSLESFDFVVVCTGMYSLPVNMPKFEGSASFEGEVIHSSQYLKRSVAEGKRVVVIGGCKSAIDIVTDVTKVSQGPPLMLYRDAHWAIPRKIAGLIPFQYIFLSRFGQALVSWYKGPYPAGAPCYHKLLSYLLFPIMWLVFRLVELIFALQLGMFGSFYPGFRQNKDVVADFYGYAHIVDYTFKRMCSRGDVKRQKGEVKRLGPNKMVELSNGEKIEADLLICATGFGKSYHYLPNEVKEKLQIEQDGHYLYRHFIPAEVRDLNLAFCGSEVYTIGNPATYYVQAEYICRFLTGRMKLPQPQEMQGKVEELMRWSRSWMPETSKRANLVFLHQVHYQDQLLRDMGENPNRMCCCLSELLMPYEPRHYAGLTKNQLGSAENSLDPAKKEAGNV